MTGLMSYLLAVDTRNCKNKSGRKDFRATQTKRLRGDEVKIGHKADKIGHGRWGCWFWLSAPIAGGQRWQNHPALVDMIDMESVLVCTNRKMNVHDRISFGLIEPL